ncbi:50S ribosomal protein L19 [bacterium]|nr:50S ribosomal protein L19 [bacterium]MCI0566300.1 50S ribosomal protein L19 [bacterium]
MTTITKEFKPVFLAERKNLSFRAGDTVRVFIKIQEKGKMRLQSFEGLVLSRNHGTEPGATFTVQKTASGVLVEKIFPLYSPVIDRIEPVRQAKTRRSKLYYIRTKTAKEIRRKMKKARFEEKQKTFGKAEKVEEAETE